MYKVLYGEEIKKYTNTFKRMEKLLPKLNEAECIILEEDKETIGYISAWKEDKKYKIENIFIRKEDRYKSAGTKLINFFINHSKKNGKREIEYVGGEQTVISFLKKYRFKEKDGKIVLDIYEDSKRKKDGFAVVISSIFLNIFLAVIKIFGGIKGKSNALLADGFNSLSDVASSTAILLGIHFSNMPEDEDHPYGHEKIESIIGIMVGIFVVITGVELGKDAVIKLLNKDYTAIPNFSTIYLAMVSIIVKYGMYFYKMKIGKATKNTALIADARDSKSDVLSSSGVVIGILLSIYVSPIFDIIVSIVVAGLILKEGISTIFEVSDIILDRQEEDFIQEIEDYIYHNTDIKNVHDIYMRRSGDKIFLSLHIRVDKNMTVYASHSLADNLEESIMTDFKEVKEVMIHIDSLLD